MYDDTKLHYYPCLRTDEIPHPSSEPFALQDPAPCSHSAASKDHVSTYCTVRMYNALRCVDAKSEKWFVLRLMYCIVCM